MLYRTLIAAGALVAGMAAAIPQAEAARTTNDLSVRTGPGIGHERIAVIPRGTYVDVGRCVRGGRWCRVDWRGRDGWAASAYLVEGSGPRYPRHHRYRRYDPGPSVYLDLPWFDLRVGGRPHFHRRHWRGYY